MLLYKIALVSTYKYSNRQKNKMSYQFDFTAIPLQTAQLKSDLLWMQIVIDQGQIGMLAGSCVSDQLINKSFSIRILSTL